MELLDVFEATRFGTMADEWRDRQSRVIDYPPGRTERGGDYIFTDPWRGHKIDETSARIRSQSTRGGRREDTT